MTLPEYVARLKSLRAAVAELRARLFTEGVDDAPVNLQTYGGDLVAIYATLTEMVKDVGGFEDEPLADAPRGLENSQEKCLGDVATLFTLFGRGFSAGPNGRSRASASA